MKEKMTYKDSGVNYDAMDPFKRAAQLAGRATSWNILRFSGFREFEASRGESAYLIETPDSFLALVEEGLGTKNLIADEMYKLTGQLFFGENAQDAVAMIVNDMITLGALPLSVAMHLAVGSSDWFKDERRSQDLIKGWAHACDLSRCTWGGGETPTLKDIVDPGTFVLSGSAVGMVKPKERLITSEKIEDGDAIILIRSSGIHANGLTLARKIAGTLPEGYLTKLSDGRSYGDALLDPTHNYVGLVDDCLDAEVDIHYAVNITGHGWRKLMRATQPFTYVINTCPEQHPVFRFLQEHGPVDDREAYGNFNMGAGFALYVPDDQVVRVLMIAERLGFEALHAGRIIEDGKKRVHIEPADLIYESKTLAVR